MCGSHWNDDDDLTQSDFFGWEIERLESLESSSFLTANSFIHPLNFKLQIQKSNAIISIYALLEFHEKQYSKTCS
jgi:hypothetical protein